MNAQLFVCSCAITYCSQDVTDEFCIYQELKSPVPSSDDLGSQEDSGGKECLAGNGSSAVYKEESSSKEVEKADLAESEEDKAKKEEYVPLWFSALVLGVCRFIFSVCTCIYMYNVLEFTFVSYM